MPETKVSRENEVQKKQRDERPPAPIARCEWNTYHGTASLTGAVQSPFPEKMRLGWRFLAGAPVYTTPVAAEERIFFANAKGTIFAVDPEGREVWSRAIMIDGKSGSASRSAAFDAPLAVFDGLLYACDGDGLVFAFDVESGNERWRRDLDMSILGTPNADVSKSPESGEHAAALYIIGQEDSSLCCVDALTGARRWITKGNSRCDSSPGVGGGRVVFGNCDSALHIFSGITGALERSVGIEGDSQVAAGVAIDRGAAFSGCRSGKVMQVNMDTGAILWSTGITDAEIFTTPAVTAQWVVIGAEDGFVYGLRRDTGEERWKQKIGGTPQSAVIAGDKVFVSSKGTLHLLRLENGQPLWFDEVSDKITGPAVAGELILVGGDDGTVAAFAGDAA